jgi:hypothetical protein
MLFKNGERGRKKKKKEGGKPSFRKRTLFL